MSKIGITKSFDLGDGRMVTLETGKLAKQANGSVVVRIGNTMLLATVVSNIDAKEGVDFLPLSVDYQEKFAAAGLPYMNLQYRCNISHQSIGQIYKPDPDSQHDAIEPDTKMRLK